MGRLAETKRSIFHVADTLGMKRADRDILDKLDPAPLETFTLTTQFSDFQLAVQDALARHDSTTGVVAIISDLDNTARTQRKIWYLITLQAGIMPEHELTFLEDLNTKPNTALVIWSEQPQEGMQAGRILSLWGKRHPNFPHCFRENDIAYFGSKSYGPFYFGYKHTETALNEVSASLIEQAGKIDNISTLVVIGDKTQDVVAANRLHYHFRNPSLPMHCYWLLGEE